MTHSHYRLSRRDFLKGAALVSLGSVLPFSHTSVLSQAAAQTTGSGLGLLNPRYPLGVSNVTVPNAVQWARDVMLLPVADDLSRMVPVYNQSLVRSAPFTSFGAEWCGHEPDDEMGHPALIRQVSAHDHTFGRRNISEGKYPLLTYKDEHVNQVFYFYNEPESGTHANTTGSMCGCFPPPDNQLIDPHADDCITTFFETVQVGFEVDNCTAENPPEYTATRIRAAALAKLFLYYKSIVEGSGNGHVFLMGSAVYPNFHQSDYWQEFFHFVHNGIGGPCGMPGIPVADLRALHAHLYHYWPSKCPSDNGDTYHGWDAVKPTAYAAGIMRGGVDWYKATYNDGQPLPLDFVLSEMGPRWEKNEDAMDVMAGNAWTGGFPNLMLGLCYWNTWLRWLTRDAWKPGHLGLAEGRKVFAMPHATNGNPYFHATRWTDLAQDPQYSAHIGQAMKSYFDFDDWDRVTREMTVFRAPDLGYGTYYDNAWTVLPETRRYHEDERPWIPLGGADTTWMRASKGRNYFFAPLGAAYTVWAHVGGDPGTHVLGAGWRYDGAQPGFQGDITLNIPGGGWSTVYVPVAKTTNGGNSEFRYWFEWVRSGSTRWAGDIPLHAGEFPNPKTYLAEGYTITPMTAMLCPMLVYSSTARSETLRVYRENVPGQDMGVSIGRPIVLGGVACTWRAERNDALFESGPQFWCPWDQP